MNWLKNWVILTTGRLFHIWYQKHGCYSSRMSPHAPHLSSSVGIPWFEHGVPAVKEFRSEELLLQVMRKNKPLPPQPSNNYWIKLYRNPQIRKQSSLRKQYGIFVPGSGAGQSLSRRRSSSRNVSSGEERGEMAVFAGYKQFYLYSYR